MTTLLTALLLLGPDANVSARFCTVDLNGAHSCHDVALTLDGDEMTWTIPVRDEDGHPAEIRMYMENVAARRLPVCPGVDTDYECEDVPPMQLDLVQPK